MLVVSHFTKCVYSIVFVLKVRYLTAALFTVTFKGSAVTVGQSQVNKSVLPPSEQGNFPTDASQIINFSDLLELLYHNLCIFKMASVKFCIDISNVF